MYRTKHLLGRTLIFHDVAEFSTYKDIHKIKQKVHDHLYRDYGVKTVMFPVPLTKFFHDEKEKQIAIVTMNEINGKQIQC